MIESTPPDPPDDGPGLPGFRSWKGVYVFVIVSLTCAIGLLAFFSRFFAR
jgi:hypothetical protein